jgi:hypothetical protein
MTSFLFVFAIITVIVITPVYIVMRNGLDYITNFDLNQIKIFQNMLITGIALFLALLATSCAL